MKDYYGQVVASVIAILVLFLFPTIFIGFQMQRTAETRANVIVEEFVDNARATGYFTDNDYERFVTEMGLLGVKWDIEMYHYSQVFVPKTGGGVQLVEFVHTKDDITQALYSDLTEEIARYNMKQGDRIEIIATSTTEFAGLGFVHMFDRGQQDKIYIQCGEMIDNNID